MASSQNEPGGLTFLTVPASDSIPQALPNQSKQNKEKKDLFILEGFLAGSENGVVLSRRGQGSWVCASEGAKGTLAGC